jgi:hypothetical protein
MNQGQRMSAHVNGLRSSPGVPNLTPDFRTGSFHHFTGPSLSAPRFS